MRILILDDEPDDSQAIKLLVVTLRDALDFEVRVARTVPEALAAMDHGPPDLVITDVFLPIDSAGHEVLGRRARHFEAHWAHLGGLVLLDELERMGNGTRVLVHTACTDASLIELLDELGHERIRKPAPSDVLLSATLGALGLPVPGS